VRLVVVEREQRELLAAVDDGDDTRRPAAEPSAAGIQQNRTGKPDCRLCIFGHARQAYGVRAGPMPVSDPDAGAG